jgi:hypothetical protein
VLLFYAQGCGRDRRSGIPCTLYEGQGFVITWAFGVAGRGIAASADSTHVV